MWQNFVVIATDKKLPVFPCKMRIYDTHWLRTCNAKQNQFSGSKSSTPPGYFRITFVPGQCVCLFPFLLYFIKAIKYCTFEHSVPVYSVVFSLIEFILKDRIQPILTFLPVKPVYLSNLNQIIPPLRSYVWNTFHSFLGWSLLPCKNNLFSARSWCWGMTAYSPETCSGLARGDPENGKYLQIFLTNMPHFVRDI